MEVTGGSLSYAMGIDYSQLAKAKGAIINYLREIGHSAEEAGKMADEAMNTLESVLKEATKEVENQADAIEVLQAAYEEINRQMEGMEDGAAKEVMEGIAEGIQGVVNEMEAMSQQDMPLDELGEGAASARQQLRDLTEELVNMKLRGEENTEEYQQLLEKVGMLKDAMADTQQAVKGMASDTATLDSVLGAAQLTAGGFSAIMGAMNLVGAGEDTKELAEAQKKLQAAIAVTTGLQSVQNALQKQSALMLGITKLQTLAAAKAENIRTAATGKGVIATGAATVAQKAFNAVAKANPYVLLAMAVLTVVGALVAFTRGSKESEEQNESLNKELEKQVEILSRLQSAYDSVYQIQKKSIENRIDLLKAQGADIEEIRRAEDELAEAERKRIEANEELYSDQMQFFDTYVEQLNAAKNTYEEYNNKVIELESRVAGTLSANDEADLKKYQELRKQWGQRVDDFREMVDALAAIQMERADFNNRMSIREATREKEDEERRVKAAREAEERRRKRLDDERQYQEELQKARERAEDLENDNLPESVESRVQKINTDYDRQIAAAEIAAEKAKNDGKLELAEQYERQVRALRQRRDEEINREYDEEARAQREALNELLSQYQSYTDRERAIREKYQKDIEELESQRDNATSAEERLRYENAITEAERQQQEALVDLELEYGALNRLNGEREQLERQILLTANRIKDANDEAEKEELVREMQRLKEELRRVNKEIAEMEEGLEEAHDELDEMTASDVLSGMFSGAAGSAKDLAKMIAEIGGATSDTADEIGVMADGLVSVVQGFAQGGVVGAVAAALSWAIDGMINLYEKTNEEIEAMNEFQAKLDKMKRSLNINDSHYDTIFGEDAIGRIERYAGAYQHLASQVSNTIRFFTDNEVSNMWDLSKYRMGGLDRNTLEELSQYWGVSLWDSDGYGYNTEFIQMVLDQYGDKLSEDEKKLLQAMLDYSESFQTAMDEIASYLTSLFGDVADTIADQFLDTFLESGQAAMNFGDVMSDVAKKMAKDFIKNMIIEQAFAGMEEDFKSIMANNNLSPQEKHEQILAWLAAAQANVEELQPDIQAYLEAMSQFFGVADEMEDAAMSGNLLQSASQDSVSLLNGQLNAVRTNQSIMLAHMDNILLQLSGIRDDMNSGFGETVRHLEAIDNNTSEGGSMLRQLGIWLG